MILKQKEIFNKLGDKNSKEMTELNNEVSPDDLKCNEFDDARSLIHEVRKGETSLSNVKKDLNQS